MNWSKLYACARQVGRIMFVGVMSAVALGFVVIGVAEVSDQDEPRYWGNYTEGGCEAPEFGWGPCRSTGRWVSDDGSIVKDPIYLDGDVAEGGTVRASFRPNGWINDEENNIVNTPQWSNAGAWFPWLAAAGAGAIAVWYSLRWWSRWGRSSTWLEVMKGLSSQRSRTGTGPPA